MTIYDSYLIKKIWNFLNSHGAGNLSFDAIWSFTANVAGSGNFYLTNEGGTPSYLYLGEVVVHRGGGGGYSVDPITYYKAINDRNALLDWLSSMGKKGDWDKSSGLWAKYNDKYAGTVENLVGKPYILGADGPDAYDCSSTACYGIRVVANSKFGDYTAHDLYKKFSVPSSSKTRGSVIFYDYTSDGRIDHVTTILNSSNMLHPSSGANVLQIKPINYLDSYTNNRGGAIYYREFNWLIINKTP